MRATLQRVRAGQDTISVTGNVLRDYLTDLFPILELGTSAKMLSIVPLLAGWRTLRNRSRRFRTETRAAVSRAGPFAMGFSRRVPRPARCRSKTKQERPTMPAAASSARALDRANGKLLENNKSPSRKVGELDNRGSHFYLALYWAQALADQTEDKDLQAKFRGIAQQLEANEAKIVEELRQSEGRAVDIGGYYHPNSAMASRAMRPSPTFNAILDSIKP